MKIFTVAFFGHRYIDNPFRIEERLEEEIRRLLSEHEYVDFLVGRDGEFDQLASSAVLRVRKQNRDDNSSLVLVLPYARAEYLNNEDSYQDYYSDVEISYAASKAHPKAAIQIRNREMVDRADLVLCYIERKSGGAYQTVLYAKNRINRLSTCRWDDNILRVKITNTRDGLKFVGKYDIIHNGFLYPHGICAERQCIFRKKRGECRDETK